MAKQGLTPKTALNLVKRDRTWALCVGSGISYPIFPLWDGLARKIVHKFVPAADSSFDDLSNKMNAEVLLQSATEIARKDHKTFSKDLADTLYEGLFDGLVTPDIKIVKQCLTSDPGTRGVNWARYLAIIQGKSPVKTTAMSLAESILRLKARNRAPSSILSFNAEMLLGSLMNAIAHESYAENKKFFDYMTEPTSFHNRDRISYYFCHGVMPVPGTWNRARNMFNADDKLVFLENEYLQLANSSYSWQSNAFINTLSNHVVYFVGLSFVDPNIRRWLAWIQEERLRALRKHNPKGVVSTSHYWIEKKPSSTIQQRMMEASVSHLGIRIIWIDDWTDVSAALENGIV